MGTLTRASAVAVLLMLLALIAVLAEAAMPSIRQFGTHFLTETAWQPNDREVALRQDGKIVFDDVGEMVMRKVPATFGALPVIYGTFASSALALLFAVPFSLGAALFLVRIAPRLRWQVRNPLSKDNKPLVVPILAPVSFLIEFLAAIPSIAYGIWGIFVLSPFLADRVEPLLRSTVGQVPGLGWLFYEQEAAIPLVGRDLFAGGTILAIMIIPIITAISRDVLQAVPRAQIEGSLALGATWWQSCREMLRYARSGLFGAIMLGLARAAGETMAVTMVIGNATRIYPSPFQPAQTMSSLLANEFREAVTDLHRSALIEVALILLVMSLLFNVVARWLVVGNGARSALAH